MIKARSSTYCALLSSLSDKLLIMFFKDDMVCHIKESGVNILTYIQI